MKREVENKDAGKGAKLSHDHPADIQNVMITQSGYEMQLHDSRDSQKGKYLMQAHNIEQSGSWRNKP